TCPEWAPWRPAIGISPRISDAELVTLAVMQALLGFVSEARWLRYARGHLRHLFPYLARPVRVQQSGAQAGRHHVLADPHACCDMSLWGAVLQRAFPRILPQQRHLQSVLLRRGGSGTRPGRTARVPRPGSALHAQCFPLRSPTRYLPARASCACVRHACDDEAAISWSGPSAVTSASQ